MRVRQRGLVISWKDTFGFIRSDASAKQDVFIHFSEIQGSGYRTLKVGDNVEFEVEMSSGRPVAKAVVLAL